MESNISRRAALGAAGAAAVATIASPALADEAGLDADVIVVGASLGGLLTAAYLAYEGKSVLVLEAASETGGTALISSGGVLTIPHHRGDPCCLPRPLRHASS